MWQHGIYSSLELQRKTFLGDFNYMLVCIYFAYPMIVALSNTWVEFLDEEVEETWTKRHSDLYAGRDVNSSSTVSKEPRSMDWQSTDNLGNKRLPFVGKDAAEQRQHRELS